MTLKKHIGFKLFFLFSFLFTAYYIFFIETEKYESKSIIMVKDLAQDQSVSALGSLLLSSSSTGMKDAKLLEIYLKSYEVYNLLNEEFNLTAYYTGEETDILHRLSENSIFPNFELNTENLISHYQKDLLISYDELSGTLEIGFKHANPVIAQKIVQSMIHHANTTLNLFEKENTKIVLTFLKEQEREKYKKFMSSLKNLLTYQNKHHTIDPNIDFQSKSVILSTLESEVVQKEVEYNNKASYLNKNTPEMKLLHANIQHIKERSGILKREIAGYKNNKELNENISDFELLKNKVEFDKELYRKVLVKLEETKVLIRQNRKNLLIVSKAGVADSYSYPNKIKDTLSIFIIMSLLYAIGMLILTIIQDHKD